MKRIFIFVSIITIFLIISTNTSVKCLQSKPLIDNISKMEKIENIIGGYSQAFQNLFSYKFEKLNVSEMTNDLLKEFFWLLVSLYSFIFAFLIGLITSSFGIILILFYNFIVLLTTEVNDDILFFREMVIGVYLPFLFFVRLCICSGLIVENLDLTFREAWSMSLKELTKLIDEILPLLSS